MPTLQQLYYLDITPEKFIDNCSAVELQEVILLANARLNRMEKTASPPPAAPTAVKALPKVAPKKALPKASTTPTVPVARGRKWTPDEEETLRRLWPNMKGTEIAKKLGREYKTVMSRAGKFGLAKNNTKKCRVKALPKPPPEPKPKKDAPAGPFVSVPKKKISVRIDKRTIVQVPAGTDVEKIKKKYNKD